MTRRRFAFGLPLALALQARQPGFQLVDATRSAGIEFHHNNGAFGRKYLPETLGPGCAFLDYDNDGWQDILLVNGMEWPGRKSSAVRSTPKLYRNNRDGTFTDVTAAAGLDVELYGMGVAVGDFNNNGFPDILITCVGQNRLFQNTGKGRFIDVTRKSGLGGRGGFSTSAAWIDYDRDGLLDLFVCNYVKWSPETDVTCTLDGKLRSYCTPEAYPGATAWLFRNRGDGTFEDVTAKAGLFDSTSKSLGVVAFDHDLDGWPDLFVANDTQPNKLYRNNRDGTFQEIGVRAGVAFDDDGRARAGMGVDAADFDNTGVPGLVVTNFHNEMVGLYRNVGEGIYMDQAPRTELGRETRRSLGFGCFFFDADLDGMQDLLVVNGHIDDVDRLKTGVRHAQPPHLFLNTGAAFRNVAQEIGAEFASPKIGRGAAFGDFDNDGDLDVLITTNGGPAYLYRNDQRAQNHSIRFRLRGTASNRDAIGATVRIFYGGETGSRMVKSGGSYLSQSELPLTFGLGGRDRIDRAVVNWPNGRTEEYKNLRSGAAYTIVEGTGVAGMLPFAAS
jgi:enediyne biosynthesis protein E4